MDNRVDVLLLQHPQEVAQAKGSARLLRLSLGRCRVLVGEQFESQVLAKALHVGQRRPLLLYPPSPGAPACERPPTGLEAEQLSLVVIDATWRKSRKILALNPALQALPRLALQDPPPSRYTNRRAEHAGQRSTLEAAVLALQALETQAERYEPLLQAFSGLVGQQLARLPRKTQ